MNVAEAEKPRHDWHTILLLAVPAMAMFAIGYWRASHDTVDDAYITFRCVANFAAGEGMTFNPGTRVEAFSNPLFALCLVPFALAGFPLELAAQLIGVLSLGVCAAAAFDVARRLDAELPFPLLAGACVLGCFPLVYYSVTGLETGMFAALIAAMAWRCIAVGGFDLAAAALGGAVAWSRPEGIAYVLAMVPAAMRLGAEERRRSLAWIGAACGLFGAGVALRLAYYGLPLPNTFYAKAAGTADLDPNNLPMLGALKYLAEFVARLGIVLPLAAAVALFRGWRGFPGMMLGGCVAAAAAFAFYAGGDWFPGSRYLLPAAPIVLALGAAQLARAASHRNDIAVAGLFSVLFASGFSIWQFQSNAARYPYHVMNSAHCRDAALTIRGMLPEGTPILAYRIGALGYFGERPVVDLFGLADNEIARRIAAIPGYHPAAAKFGEADPELRRIIMHRDPKALLAVSFVKREYPPALNLLGTQFRLAADFPQGADQRWLLYLRADFTPSAAGSSASR